MARSYTLGRMKDKAIVADRLPMSEDSDLTRVLSGSSSAGFVMPVNHKRTPKDWRSQFTRLDKFVAVVDDSLPQPLWGGYVTDRPTSGGGKVTIEATTFEGLLENGAFVGDQRFDNVDVISVIARQIGGYLEDQGVGFIDEFDCPASGVLRTKYFKSSDDVTIADALESLGVKWSIRLRWADAAKSAFKVVFWARTADSGLSTNPKLAFELDGPVSNIASFDYAAPQNGQEAATRLIVVGEGSGDTRVRSAAVTDTQREVYVPRREVRLNVPGLLTVADCNYYRDAVKDDYFARRDAVTLTAYSNGATGFADIMDLGMSARVNIHADELDFEDVAQVVGWSVGKTTRIFTPTLIKLGSGSVRFPKSVDPAKNTARDALKKSVQRAINRDPIVNGYSWPSSSGGKVTMGPDGFGAYDSAGTALGGFDSTGTGFGKIGGGGGGSAVQRATVDTGSVEGSIDVTVLIGGVGSPVAVKNFTGRTLITGDVVDVTKDDSGETVVLGKGLNGDGSVDQVAPGFRYRVYTDYPWNGDLVQFPLASSFEDTGDAFGLGNRHTVVSDANSGTAIYNFDTGVQQGIAPPSGYGFLSNGIHVDNRRAYHWFLDGEYPRLFELVNGAWQLVPGLPTTPNAFTTGMWDSTSFGGEVFSRPVVGILRVAGNTITSNRFPAEAIIKSIDPTSGLWVTQSVQFNPSTTVAISSGTVSTSVRPVITVWGGGAHVFFTARFTHVTGSSSSQTFTYLYHLDISTGVFTYKYGAISNVMQDHCGTNTPRLGIDGTLYGLGTTPSNSYLLYRRKLSDTSPSNIKFRDGSSYTDEVQGVQRDGISDRYFIAHRETDAVITTVYVGVVKQVDFATGFVGEVIRANEPANYNELPSTRTNIVGASPAPRQMPDGSVVINMHGGYGRSTVSNNVQYLNHVYKLHGAVTGPGVS